MGTMRGVREAYYATSQERRVTHPRVPAIIGAAEHRLLTP